MSLSDADNLVRTIADPEDPFTSHTAGVALNRLLFDPPVKKPFPKCFRKVAMLFHRRLNERSFWTPPPLKSPVGISFGVSNILAATHDILKTLRLKIDEESTHWNVCALEWLKGWEQGDDGDADWLFTLSDLQLDGHVKTCAVVVVLDFFKLQERVNFTQREVERVTTSQASENNAPIAASEIGRKFCTKATEAGAQLCRLIHCDYNPLRRKTLELLTKLFRVNNEIIPPVLACVRSYLGKCSLASERIFLWWTRINSPENTNYCELWSERDVTPTEIDREVIRRLVFLLLRALHQALGECGHRTIILKEIEMIVGTCGALVNDAHLPKRLYQLVIEDDTQMVELILLVTEVHLVPGLLEMLRSTPYLSQVLQTCNPHLLLLKFLIECMDEELLLDMLSSTETSLLELFLVYFKYLSLTEDNWRRAIRQYTYFEESSRSNSILSNSNESSVQDQFCEMLCRLSRRIRQLWADGAFPYRPDALLRRLDVAVSIASRK